MFIKFNSPIGISHLPQGVAWARNINPDGLAVPEEIDGTLLAAAPVRGRHDCPNESCFLRTRDSEILWKMVVPEENVVISLQATRVNKIMFGNPCLAAERMGWVKIAPVHRKVTCQYLPLSRWQLLVPWNEVHLNTFDSLGSRPVDDADVRDGFQPYLFDKIPSHVMVSEDHPELRSLNQKIGHLPGGLMDLIGHVSHQVIDHVTQEENVRHVVFVGDGSYQASGLNLLSQH
jgi:hypothetical protein